MTEDSKKKEVPVDIFSHVNYRDYLKAVYNQKKTSNEKFSERWFARQAGVGSKNYLRMVIDGVRNLTPISAAKFARGLKLSRKETSYFESMVLYDAAKDEMDKDRYFQQMLKLRPKARVEGIDRDRLAYVTDSLNVIVREMAMLPNFNDDPEWIAKHLRRPVKAIEVQAALKLLERLHLLVRGPDGRLKHTGTTLESPPEADAIEFFNYHRQVLAQGKDTMTNAPHDEWDVSSKTIAIGKDTLPKVMAALRRFQDEITQLVHNSGMNFKDVYQINMQLFPVTDATAIKKTT